MAKPTYDLLVILEMAVAACEVNAFSANAKNGYVKSDYPLKRTVFGETTEEEAPPEDYDGKYDTHPYVFANRNLIKENLGIGSLTRWNPEKHNIPKLVITPEHKITAQAIKKHFNALTFKAVADKMNDFEKAVFKVITTKEVSARDIGIISALPGSYTHDIKRKADLAHKKKIAKVSDYVGEVGARMDLELNIVSHHYIERFDCNIVNAVTPDDNMVAFFTGKSAATFGSKCKVRGTIKRNEVSKYNNAKESFLTRVAVTEKIVNEK